MAETSTTATVASTTATTTAVDNIKYQISDEDLKSLRNSRHSHHRYGTTPRRNHSGGSNKSRDQSPSKLDNSRYSNRSSHSSLWSNLMMRGRRIYGSAASVASSITFAEDFSGEFFWNSERSLDTQQVFAPDDQVHDSQPNLPERQASLAAGQSSSLLSGANLSNSANLSDHSKPPPFEPKKSSDLSPKQPGRKVSLAPPFSVNLSDHSNPSPIESKRSSDLSPKQPGRKVSLANSSLDRAHIALAAATESTPRIHRTNTNDTVPQYPSRKQSLSKDNQEELLKEVHATMEQAKLFVENLSLSNLEKEGTSYENSFTGAAAIDHMLEVGLVARRQEGVELGMALQQELGVFHNVWKDDNQTPSFRDNDQDIYQLTCTEGATIPNAVPSPVMPLRRQTDTSIRIEEEAPLEERTAKQLTIPHTTTTTTSPRTTKPTRS